MNVGDICKREVVTVRPNDEILTAARLMRQKHVGYLVVAAPAYVEGTFMPTGVLTDRDLVVTVLARDADPATLRVEDVMTSKPIVVREDDAITTALAEMRRIGVRRMPVIGTRGELVGVVSLDDIIEQLARQLQDVAGSVRSEQLVEHAVRA
jgi:CBS domain-containing protein